MPTCKECTFFKAPAEGSKGTCVVFPPLENGFPAVDAGAWCGQYITAPPAPATPAAASPAFSFYMSKNGKSYTLTETAGAQWDVKDGDLVKVGEAADLAAAEIAAEEHSKGSTN